MKQQVVVTESDGFILDNGFRVWDLGFGHLGVMASSLIKRSPPASTPAAIT